MSVRKIAFTSILLATITSCQSTSLVEINQPVSIVGKWKIIGALSRDSRSDVRPEIQTLYFSKDGVFKSWCRISEKNIKNAGEYTIELTKNNSVDIAVRIKTGRIHPINFKFTNVKRGDVEGRDSQGIMKIYEDILTFTDHGGRKRAYIHE